MTTWADTLHEVLYGTTSFYVVVAFTELGADLIRMRTREGMAIAKAKGKLKVSSGLPTICIIWRRIS